MTARNSSNSQDNDLGPAVQAAGSKVASEQASARSDTVTGSSPGSPITLMPEDLRKSSAGIDG
ncbi:MAG: hypothetical protein ISS31_09780 [Kiritimatiellae bacterium]|nr:hypothetical protein [Kiritimatiellia bacterium]